MAGCVWETPNATAVATYWKNGKPVNLTDGLQTAVAHAIVISGNDVYLAGSEGGNAVFWKNGNSETLAYGGGFFVPAEATAMAISGPDVYIAGAVPGAFPGTNTGHKVAVYWKNGVQVNLTPDSVLSVATDIAVSGSDVYVVGRERDTAVYWKNGDTVHLTHEINEEKNYPLTC